MMQRKTERASRSARAVAAAVSLSLAVTPALAEKARSLGDLVGAKAAGGLSDVEARGFAFAGDGPASDYAKISYYWNARDKNCIRVETRDGRISSIEDAADSDCKQHSSSSGAIAAGAVGAALIGALLLSKKKKHNNDAGYQQDWQQVEVYNLDGRTMRIFANPSRNAQVRGQFGPGTQLKNFGCDGYDGESWCEVATFDNRTRGWARDLVLRPVQGVGSGALGNGWNGASEQVEVYGVPSGTLNITAGPSRNERVVGRVGNRTLLNRLGCERISKESWCRITTTDRQMYGWAREDFLRPVSNAGYYPPAGDYYQPAQFRDLIGARAAGAMDALQQRGFTQVDSFVSGNARYNIQWRGSSRQCLQVIVSDGRIDNITDIGSHPRCR